MIQISKKSKLILLLLIIICIPTIYIFAFPKKTPEEQLFSAIDRLCALNCTLHLHDVTSFEWDKAYFFPYKTLSKTIETITNTNYNFDTDTNTEQKVVFIKNNQVIFYESLFEYIDLMVPWQIPSTAIQIDFNLSKEELSELNYTGHLDQTKNFININYYEIKPQNDTLNFHFYQNKRIHQKSYLISPTNLQQISLQQP